MYFKGQVTPAVFECLEEYNIYHSLLPSNITDRLQPVDLAVNKPIKVHLKKQFEE